MPRNDDERIENILNFYYTSFLEKTYNEENEDSDFLMDIYGITPALKRENRQYWGRELGMLWQKIVVNIAEHHCVDYRSALRYGDDEPCDLVIGKDAIDTKYRVGSGDSGTLKKFKQYGERLKKEGYNPIFLIVREDNLPAAISAAKNGGWTVYTGQDTVTYIEKHTGINIIDLLAQYGDVFKLNK